MISNLFEYVYGWKTLDESWVFSGQILMVLNVLVRIIGFKGKKNTCSYGTLSSDMPWYQYRALRHNYFIPGHRKYTGQQNQCDIRAAHDGKVCCNTIEFFLWHGINPYICIEWYLSSKVLKGVDYVWHTARSINVIRWKRYHFPLLAKITHSYEDMIE